MTASQRDIGAMNFIDLIDLQRRKASLQISFTLAGIITETRDAQSLNADGGIVFTP
jgi:hypothetical protein